MPDKDESKEEQNNTPNKDNIIFGAAISFFGLCLLLVAIHFSISSFGDCVNNLKTTCTDNEWADYRAAWGQFGDFMGGMVNPFLGLLTVYLLVTELRQSRAAQERSEIALREQIDLAKSQNNFANYFKHLGLFEEYTERTSKELKVIEAIDWRLMHSLVYPNAKKGNYDINRKLLFKAIQQNIAFLKALKSFEQTHSPDDLQYKLAILAGDNLEVISGHLQNSISFDETTIVPIKIPTEFRKKQFFDHKINYTNDSELIDVNLPNGKIGHCLLLLSEIYQCIKTAYNFEPRERNRISLSIDVIGGLANIIPEPPTSNQVELIDKDSYEKLINYIQHNENNINRAIRHLETFLYFMQP
jgi:tetratricopeptide (TPR) repeat protein